MLSVSRFEIPRPSEKRTAVASSSASLKSQVIDSETASVLSMAATTSKTAVVKGNMSSKMLVFLPTFHLFIVHINRGKCRRTIEPPTEESRTSFHLTLSVQSQRSRSSPADPHEVDVSNQVNLHNCIRDNKRGIRNIPCRTRPLSRRSAPNVIAGLYS